MLITDQCTIATIYSSDHDFQIHALVMVCWYIRIKLRNLKAKFAIREWPNRLLLPIQLIPIDKKKKKVSPVHQSSPVTVYTHTPSTLQWVGRQLFGVLLITGLDYWTGTLDWTTGLTYFWFSHILRLLMLCLLTKFLNGTF